MTKNANDEQDRRSPRRSLSERTAHWWKRRGSKESGFWYQDATGRAIKQESKLARIKSLVIPPAWTNVRIAPAINAALQAIGTDTSGRTQYLYHPRFIERREKKKFSRLPLFGERLPLLRKVANDHINQSQYTKERVLAVIVRLINDLYFRVGSEKSVERYKTFGVTTLRAKHLTIKPGRFGKPTTLDFHFVGKHHVPHRRILVDEELARVMADLRSLPGARLFKYYGEDGKLHPITANDVNSYIKSLTNGEFTAKDFRTWGGTLVAAIALAEQGLAASVRECKKKIVTAVKRVAERLGNTPSVCRGSYIHPQVIRAYERGVTLEDFRKSLSRNRKKIEPEYEPEELALLKLLRKEI